MSSDKDLDIHWASDEEKLQAYRNVHEFWGGGRTLEEHLAWRQQSPQHQRAKWCVGCVDGRVVSSLGCYPMQYRVQEQVVDGIAIGAVHTLPEARGTGFAPRLIDWVEQEQSRAGAQLSLLYSDIKPDYYARLGYFLSLSYELEMELPPTSVVDTGVSLTTRTPDDAFRKQYEEAYERAHADYAFSVHRGRDYWDYLWARDPEDAYLEVRRAGDTLGYVRVGRGEETTLRDIAVADDVLADVISAVAQAAGSDANRLYGWAPNEQFGTSSPLAVPSGQIVERQQAITMIKPLGDREFSVAVLQDAQYLREIDHV